MDLQAGRRHIDELDEQIVGLLQQRAHVAEQIGRIKASSGTAVYDPAREAQLLDRLAADASGPLPPQALRAVYRQIISACRNLQRPVRAAYLGPAYTFSHMAAVTQFGETAELLPTLSIEEVFAAVEREAADCGIVPIENSIQGVEARTLDCLFESPLSVCAETYIPVHLQLLASCPLEQVRTVHSHPQPLGQSRGWLRANLPTAELVHESSTSAAAAAVVGVPGHAAVATIAAAEAYGLDVIASDIEDLPDNRTRFLVICRDPALPSGRDKTSVIFMTEHQAGALYRALAPFSAHGISLTLIQSRPARGAVAGPYYFYVDFEGHADAVNVGEAVKALREQCSLVKVLGSYPATG